MLSASVTGAGPGDVARLALVMAVAALDTFMHAVVLSSVSANRGAVPKALMRLDLRFDELVQLAESTVAAQSANRPSRPWVQVKNALHRALLTVTFQSYVGVGNALAMAGVKDAWKKVATTMGCTPTDIKTRLGGIVHRRNQIVHEGDLRRLVRPQTIGLNAISKTDVSADIDWLEQLIAAIDANI